MSRKRIALAIANASQGNRKTSPAPEAEAEAATEAATERLSTTRVAGYTTSFSYVTASGRRPDVMVSATRLDHRVGLQAIEHLDFEAVIACECMNYDDDATPCDRTAELILQDTPCTRCGVDDGRWLCSITCWDEMAGALGVICGCGAEFDRDDVLRIIGRLS